MIFVWIKQLIFTDPVVMQQICGDDIVLDIQRRIITKSQRPVIIRTNQWPPHTLQLVKTEAVNREGFALNHVKILSCKIILLPGEGCSELQHGAIYRIVAMHKTCWLFMGYDGDLV